MPVVMVVVVVVVMVEQTVAIWIIQNKTRQTMDGLVGQLIHLFVSPVTTFFLFLLLFFFFFLYI